MFIAMNRFRVKKGSEEDFEKVWLSRDSHLDKVPGFVEFVHTSGWRHEEAEGRLYIHDVTGGVVAGVIQERFPGQQRLIRRATLEDVFLHRAGRALKE